MGFAKGMEVKNMAFKKTSLILASLVGAAIATWYMISYNVNSVLIDIFATTFVAIAFFSTNMFGKKGKR